MRTQGSNRRVDVAIVGAGAAGLAAGRDLYLAGYSVLLLEARNRVGGRVFTLRPHRSVLPIELGAEFVHGRADEVTQIAKAADLPVLEIEGMRVDSSGAKLRRLDDFWQRLDTVMRRLPDRRQTDLSFADFLKGQPGGRALARNRRLARAFVEGYHAADCELISAESLREGGSPSDDQREQRLGRMIDGYDRVIDWLASSIRERIRTRSPVTGIDWRDSGFVRLTTTSGSHLRARSAIVTVPVGVLQASPASTGALHFDPPLDVKRSALTGLAMGCVTRIVLLFREAVWAEERFVSRVGMPTDLLAFLQGESTDFPVWWTAYPSRIPLITGWCGGPRAATLSGLRPAALAHRAVRSLALQLRVSAGRLERLLLGAWSHDWNRDPYARGAYSYQVIGGADAASALARPVGGRLFFAGEATDTEGATGTVHGAIASGRRAARQVRRALNRR
jgi:monoamine oxidase